MSRAKWLNSNLAEDAIASGCNWWVWHRSSRIILHQLKQSVLRIVYNLESFEGGGIFGISTSSKTQREDLS